MIFFALSWYAIAEQKTYVPNRYLECSYWKSSSLPYLDMPSLKKNIRTKQISWMFFLKIIFFTLSWYAIPEKTYVPTKCRQFWTTYVERMTWLPHIAWSGIVWTISTLIKIQVPQLSERVVILVGGGSVSDLAVQIDDDSLPGCPGWRGFLTSMPRSMLSPYLEMSILTRILSLPGCSHWRGSLPGSPD